jgi:anion-transporting  ArsA/GET3 family ATPase
VSAVVLIVGSGGVGKTTLSAAIAADLARSGRHTLVLTVDPARRLAQALGIHLGSSPSPVPGLPGLDAAMIDASESWEGIIRAHADTATAERLLDNRFFRAVADRFPSGQAYASADEMARHADSGTWDVVVVDTPPSGGGIDVLAAPRRIRALVGGRALRWLTGPAIPGRRALYSITARPALHIADTVLGGPLLEDVAEFLIDLRVTYDGIAKRSRHVEARFRAASTAIVTTADPEPMRETARFFSELPEWAARPRAVVFNRALPSTWSPAADKAGGDQLDANLHRWGEEALRQAEARAEVVARYGLDPIVVPWMADAPDTPVGLADLAAATGRLGSEALGI